MVVWLTWVEVSSIGLKGRRRVSNVEVEVDVIALRRGRKSHKKQEIIVNLSRSQGNVKKSNDLHITGFENADFFDNSSEITPYNHKIATHLSYYYFTTIFYLK